MKLRMVHDDIDPDVPPDVEQHDPGPGETSDDQYIIGEDGHRVVNLELSAALAKKVERARSWVRPAAAALMVLFIGLTAWNVVRLTHPARELPKPTPFQLKQALYLGVMRLEAFRKTHDGVAPATLAEAGLPENAGYVYNRTGSATYNITFVHDDDPTFHYDSNIPVDTYFGSAKTMLAMGDTR
jgi:hypothetical protein